jgi:hypothetical protein
MRIDHYNARLYIRGSDFNQIADRTGLPKKRAEGLPSGLLECRSRKKTKRCQMQPERRVDRWFTTKNQEEAPNTHSDSRSNITILPGLIFLKKNPEERKDSSIGIHHQLWDRIDSLCHRLYDYYP